MSPGAADGPGEDGAPPLIFLIAGEPSGDALGARLMAALRRRTAGRVRFAGLGGERMQAEGLDSLFPIAELSLFGIFEVLPRIPRLLARMRETAAAARTLRPAAVVSIDSPGFNVGVWRRLRGGGITLIHYVAPTVWAWRPGRARKFARYLDHLLALLPFEPPLFENAGLACTFVGHPVLESGADGGDGAAFRRRYGIDPADQVLCVLPGSRRGEIARLLPPFRDALAVLARRPRPLHAVVPAVPSLAREIAAACEGWPIPVTVVSGEGEKYDAMAASDAALAASGTVALELALAGVPAVVAYRLNPLTHSVVSHMVQVRYANLVNLLLDRAVVPELIQERCRGDLLAAEVARLLDDEAARRTQAEGAAEALAMLRPADGLPSDCAAAATLDVIARRART